MAQWGIELRSFTFQDEYHTARPSMQLCRGGGQNVGWGRVEARIEDAVMWAPEWGTRGVGMDVGALSGTPSPIWYPIPPSGTQSPLWYPISHLAPHPPIWHRIPDTGYPYINESPKWNSSLLDMVGSVRTCFVQKG